MLHIYIPEDNGAHNWKQQEQQNELVVQISENKAEGIHTKHDYQSKGSRHSRSSSWTDADTNYSANEISQRFHRLTVQMEHTAARVLEQFPNTKYKFS